MTEWIDVLVYTSVIVTVWVLLPVWSSRFARAVVADRNPEWLAQHPDVAATLTSSRWFLWSCMAWGALSAAVLLSFQLGAWPQAWSVPEPDTPKWEALKDINSTLLIIGLVYLLVCCGLSLRWLYKYVPLAEHRQATLERRSIDDFVPRWLRIVTYTLVGLHAAAWLTVGVLELYSTPIFWMRLGLVIGISAIFFLMSRLGVRRRPNAMDRIFGPAYRRIEVRYGFLMQLVPLAGIVRLYEEVTATVAVDVNRALHLAVALTVVLWFVRFALLSESATGPGGSPAAKFSRSATTLLTLALLLTAVAQAGAQRMD
jgi:hypothetical protein